MQMRSLLFGMAMPTHGTRHIFLHGHAQQR